MRASWLVALVACDVPLDLKQVPPPDAPPACFSTTFGQTMRTLMAADVEDSALSSEMPDVVARHTDTLPVTGTDPAIFKFDVSGIVPGERIGDVKLHLWAPGEGKNCTGTDSCTMCLMDAVTSSQMSWMTSDWSSTTVTFAARDGTTPWTTSDVGPAVATAVLPEPALNFPFVLEMTTADLTVAPPDSPECWIEGTNLSIQVTLPDRMWITSRFHTTACDTRASSPVLELTLYSD